MVNLVISGGRKMVLKGKDLAESSAEIYCLENLV
jgi:hypothetical protein